MALGFLYGLTEYSMQRSMVKINDYVNFAKEEGYEFLTMTDNNLHGFFKFYKACQNNNIKPVIGLEVILNSSYLDSDIVLIYAKNEKGLKSLFKITYLLTKKDLIDLEDLVSFKDDIIVVSSAYNSPINRFLVMEEYGEVKKYLTRFADLFPNFYIGMSSANMKSQFIMEKLVHLGDTLNIKYLPLNSNLYLKASDKDKALILNKMRDSNFSFDVDDDFHLLSKNELINAYQDYPKVFDYLDDFYNQVNIYYEYGSIKLPIYPNDKNVDSKTYLRSLSLYGLKRRLSLDNIKNDKPYLSRLDYELEIIDKMGYNDYFLIVYDYVCHAKKHHIMVGPGRGSAASSLVGYSLGITNVDPIKYHLLFERFLNPSRKQMPDIDVDFPDDKRDEIISYVKEKYGSLHVASIVAFDTLKAKSAIRDVARVLNTPLEKVNALTKKISWFDNLSDLNLDLDDEMKNIVDISMSFENLPRHTSTHASGVVFTSSNLDSLIPVEAGLNGLLQSSVEASDLEEIGLLKFDFLGIKNLRIIDNTVQQIKSFEPDFDINKIPLNDSKTFELFSKADTMGIFQLESEGIKNVLKKLKPNSLMDITSVLALYRPGPMENIDEFIARKNGKRFEYLDSSLSECLGETYGIIVFQEQIIQIASSFAGYSLADSDVLRRAVSKKKEEVLKDERKKFIEKALSNGKDSEKANQIFDLILKFANYGFNKAHAVSYAFISYQMAYLKANYYPQFIACLTDNELGTSKMNVYYMDALKHGYKMVKPDINHAEINFKVMGKYLVYPLIGIKGINYDIANKIIKERNNKPFTSLDNFKMRINPSDSQLDSLIFSSSFDSFKMSKKFLFENKNVNLDAFKETTGSDIVYDDSEFPYAFLRTEENKALGFNLTYNLSSRLASLRNQYNIPAINLNHQGFVKIIAICDHVKEYNSKNGKMLFLNLSDELSQIEAVVFNEYYQEARQIIKIDNVYLFEGKLDNSKNKLNFIVSKIFEVQTPQ